jgi:hypothetical protein
MIVCGIQMCVDYISLIGVIFAIFTINSGPKNIKSKLDERIFSFKHKYSSTTSFDCSLARDCEKPWEFLEHT